MVVVGLTGSIATGKSFVARCFSKLGAAVFDADKTVHELLTFGGAAVKPIQKAFPEAYSEGAINRKILGNIVFTQPEKRKILEAIVHPLVQDKRNKFLTKCRKDKVKLVVLEIPLLFETQAEKICDCVVVTTADPAIQEQRAMARPGMTKEKFQSVNQLQLSQKEKAKFADFIIDTGRSEFAVFREVKDIVKRILKG